MSAFNLKYILPQAPAKVCVGHVQQPGYNPGEEICFPCNIP